ncbi:hypothetical protein F2Q69_00054478 [Brassica cretica]|uniref:Uncharacterized protein n=1 Tax=Brassica cretica TaxID=69181 RepID=A0A8S9N2W8_BRACR|nr:hypothetical protein F2Q69_00054478 [Brassica cretica]
MADSYLDVLVSLKEKWEKKKAATDCEARLRFWRICRRNKVPSAAYDVTKCSGDCFEDGEFSIEE